MVKTYKKHDSVSSRVKSTALARANAFYRESQYREALVIYQTLVRNPLYEKMLRLNILLCQKKIDIKKPQAPWTDLNSNERTLPVQAIISTPDYCIRSLLSIQD